MPPKTQPKKWCDPYVAGLFPVIGVILGSVLCMISHKITGTLIDDSEWTCTRFDNGECVQYSFKPLLPKQAKVIHND